MSKTVLLAGASGLVGQHALATLLRANINVIAATRRPLAVHSALLVEAPLTLTKAALPHGLDAFVCALGTTLAKAGSKDAFLAVDRDLVLSLARVAREAGCQHALLVSSVGADSQARNFYLRSKGEVEQAISALGFARVDILQPGVLLGERSESRPGEYLAQRLAPLYNPLLRGALARYRGIDARIVGAAIGGLLARTEPGIFRHTHHQLMTAATDD
jgi:uncharacterized protein YbjT (DUF2867 family)